MNKHFKRALIGATTLLAAAMLVGCSSKSSGGEEGYVGISMPTKSAERWIADGTNMVKQLEKEGFKTDLQYGEDKVGKSGCANRKHDYKRCGYLSYCSD